MKFCQFLYRFRNSKFVAILLCTVFDFDTLRHKSNRKSYVKLVKHMPKNEGFKTDFTEFDNKTDLDRLTYRPFDLPNMNESLVGMTKEKMRKNF